MLNKGIRDEQNEKINTVLAQLLTPVFVPEQGNDLFKNKVEKQLEKVDLSIQKIIEFDVAQLLSYLDEASFDWANCELFADFLVNLSATIEVDKAVLKEKAMAIYHYIQQESKTFSLAIFNKINHAKT